MVFAEVGQIRRQRLLEQLARLLQLTGRLHGNADSILEMRQLPDFEDVRGSLEGRIQVGPIGQIEAEACREVDVPAEGIASFDEGALRRGQLLASTRSPSEVPGQA